jgi:hypothetical protein
MMSKSKNKNLEQLLSNKTGQIPEQAKLLLELDSTLRRKSKEQPCLEKNAFKNYKQIKKRIENLFSTLELML